MNERELDEGEKKIDQDLGQKGIRNEQIDKVKDPAAKIALEKIAEHLDKTDMQAFFNKWTLENVEDLAKIKYRVIDELETRLMSLITTSKICATAITLVLIYLLAKG